MLQLIDEAVKKSGFDITGIISGHCWGIDQVGEEYALGRNFPLEIYPANWAKLGKKAGHARNIAMAEAGDALICLAAEGSRGSMDMIKIIEDLGKPFYAMILG